MADKVIKSLVTPQSRIPRQDAIWCILELIEMGAWRNGNPVDSWIDYCLGAIARQP